MTNELTVANEIKNQIGTRALFMLGACNILGGEKELTFKIRGCRKVTHITITLDPSDTYTVTFCKCRGFEAPTTVKEVEMVHADGLCQVIEINTGLAVSL